MKNNKLINIAEESIMFLDTEMKLWNVNIMASLDLPDYETSLNIAQSKIDNIFETDKTKIPIIMIIDYRWKHDENIIFPSCLSDDINSDLIKIKPFIFLIY